MKKQTSATSEASLKVKNIIDFTGKTIYVGIDVHKKDYQVAKLCDSLCLGNVRMSANAAMLIKHLQTHYPGAYFKCVYESCAWGFNLQRKLSGAGMECIVVHAADVSTNDKERKRKTDKVDALKLAQSLASGYLRPIHVPDEISQKRRSLMRYRGQLASDLTRTKNRLKGALKFNDLEIPEQFDNGHWSKNFLDWVHQQGLQDPYLGDTLVLMAGHIRLLRQQLLDTERALRRLARTHYDAQTKLAMSVPGIGSTTAMLFVLEIGDINRFKNFDALNDFIGFCPDTADSGETYRSRGMTTRRHKKLRSGFVEASWRAIRIDPALLQSYQELTKRMKGVHAIIRIARKLLRRLRTVLITGVPYQLGVTK